MSALRQEDLDDRREQRWPLRLEVVVRTPDLAKRAAVLTELSPRGCRLLLSTYSQAGATYLVYIPGLSPRAGTLIWNDGVQCGFSFDAPLHISVVDHLVRLHPAY